MKTFALIGLTTFAMFSAVATAQLSDEQIEQIIAGDVGLWKFRETASVADRKSVVDYLRRHGYEKREHVEDTYGRLLVEYGDEAMIDEYTKRYADQPARIRDELARSGSPRVIEAAIPILFKEEPFEYYCGDVPMVPPSYYVASNTIPLLLSQSPAFSAEVINWAQSFLIGDQAKVFGTGKSNWTAQRALFRQWWRDNEQHFRVKDYKAVRPPPLEIPEYIAPQAPATAGQSEASVVSPKPTAPDVQAPAAAVEQRGPIWPWVVSGIIALVVIAALALKRRA